MVDRDVTGDGDVDIPPEFEVGDAVGKAAAFAMAMGTVDVQIRFRIAVAISLDELGGAAGGCGVPAGDMAHPGAVASGGRAPDGGCLERRQDR